MLIEHTKLRYFGTMTTPTVEISQVSTTLDIILFYTPVNMTGTNPFCAKTLPFISSLVLTKTWCNN